MAMWAILPQIYNIEKALTPSLQTVILGGRQHTLSSETNPSRGFVLTFEILHTGKVEAGESGVQG